MSIESVIKNKSDIVEYIQTRNLTQLERTGSTIRGCCPICKGDNPTQFVASEKVFHCHKCKTGGNIISFVQYLNRISYHMAVEQLAEELNINYEGNQQYQEDKAIVKENERITKECRSRLFHVIDYLTKERGLSKEICDKFQLGYTPNGFIFIPIHDIYGRIVAYSRRQFGRSPKYINSKNNSLFEKSATLFNIHRAKLLMENTLYVCEGYFDSIVGHQQGLPTVAYLGSELTKSQIKLIRSICVNPASTIIICADNDEAGLSSIKRTRENFRQIAPNLSVRVLIIPDTEFEFVNNTGTKELRACKDLNDLHIQGISINTLQTKHIDQYCLEEILHECQDIQTQYIAVGEFVKSVTNPMIRSDIAKFLAEKWEQDISDIKNWFQVVDKAEDDANLFKTASQSLKQLEEEVAEGFLDFGFPTIDRSLEGVRKKDVVLIGAYPSIGKTFLAGQLLLHFVLRHKLRVLFFSLEMSAGALMERLAAALIGVSTKELISKVESGELGETYEKIKDTLDKYIRIVDVTNLTISDIDRIIKQANLIQFSQPVDVIIIDYLQIMGGMDSFEEKEATAKNLKPLAKNNNVLLITLSQLARGTNSWERPTMNKLKGGGANEAVGDIILMLYKKAENPKLTLEEQNELKDVITISIEKGRRGYSIKEVDLKIDKTKTRIYEM